MEASSHERDETDNVFKSYFRQDTNRAFPILLSDGFGRNNLGVDILGWISILKIVIKLTGVRSLVNWFQDWVTRDRYRQDRQELIDTQRRLQSLEKRVERLTLEQKTLTELSNQRSCMQCTCPAHGSKVTINNPGCAPPGIPTPPPPPPPPPLPPVMSYSRQILAEKNNNKMKPKDKKLETPSKGILLTAADLQNVKLKKPLERKLSLNGYNNSTQGLVTEEDLKNKKLNKVLLNTPNKENLQQRLAQEVISFKCGLKKTDIKRSPGGTPVVNRKRKLRKGNGLAPVMAIALKKKFITVHSSPDSSDYAANSPFSTETSPLV